VIEKNFYFMAGIPRSGSTLLLSILNQNPAIYGTPTSPLIDLLVLNEHAWRNCQSVIANPVEEQLENISESIINGCWKHIPQNIIIDKHRAWCRNLQAVEKIFKKKPKIIVTVRDIPSTIASFIQLNRKSKQSPSYLDRILFSKNLPLNDESRAEIIWNEFIFDPWSSFRTGYETDKSCLLLVDYDDLMNNKESVIEKVYQFLGLPVYKHDFENIESKTKDDDLLAWGFEDLHTIRPKLEKTAKDPREILGEPIYNKYNNMNLEFWK
jgi:sulfotransferase